MTKSEWMSDRKRQERETKKERKKDNKRETQRERHTQTKTERKNLTFILICWFAFDHFNNFSAVVHYIYCSLRQDFFQINCYVQIYERLRKMPAYLLINPYRL